MQPFCLYLFHQVRQGAELQESKKMMTAMLFGCVLGLVFVATLKSIQHNNRMVKESAKLHEQNMKQIKINNLQVCQ